MTSGGLPDLFSDTPILLEIRIRAAFDETSCDVARDQAALAGLLDALFGLNATVMSVTTVEPT